MPPEITRGATGLLDIHVRDIELGTLLEMLSYEARANIVTTTSVKGTISANLYSVSLEQALAAVLTPNKYAFRAVGTTIFVGAPEEMAALAPPPVTRVFKLRYVRPEEAAEAAKAILGKDANVVTGKAEQAGAGRGGTAGGGAGGGGGSGAEPGPAGVEYLIVTARSDQLAAVEKLLAEIDQRPRQVLIEATILRATLNESNQFGIDFTLLGGIDFRNVGSRSHASSDLTTGPLPSRKFEQTTFNANTDFAGNVASGGFTFGLIRNNIAAFVRALEEVTDVVVVANPKIVGLNRQEGEVIVGRRDGYKTTTVTQTAAIETVDFLETGTQLRFRPIINDDGTVRLLVHPKDSNGGLTAANLPFEETTEAHADLLLNDGDTVLIGGLFRERTVMSRSQIPLLGNLPGAGLLFQSRSDQTVREEVIILLTVHILTESPREQAEFRRLLEDVERIRVGSRKGLLGTGRERLAQAFYHEALRQLEEGDCDQALLNVRMTLGNQPKHLAALTLKEQLLGRRLWDEEGSRMRTFIWELMAAERPPATPAPPPPFGRPQVQVVPPPPDDFDQEARP